MIRLFASLAEFKTKLPVRLRFAYELWGELAKAVVRNMIADLIRLQLAWPGGELEHVSGRHTRRFADNFIR